MLHLLCVSRASSWSLRGRWRFLTGVLVGFEVLYVSRIYPGSYISIFNSLPSLEVLHLLCVSRPSSWSLRGRWRFLTGVLVVFYMVDVSWIHQGSYISIFKSLPAWEVHGEKICAKCESVRESVSPWVREVLVHWAAYAAKNWTTRNEAANFN